MSNYKIISNIERLIISNQYKIMAMLATEEYEIQENARISQIFENGNPYLYNQYLNHIKDGLNSEEQDFTLAVLELFDAIRLSLKTLTIDEVNSLNQFQVKFQSFDKHHEVKFYEAVKEIRKHGEFVEVIDSGAESAFSPKAELYTNMIAVWESLGRPVLGMTLEQIENILNI